MNDLALERSSKNLKLQYAVKFLGFSLPVISVIIACALTFLPHWSFEIKKPLILLAGSLIVIIPFRTENIITLQRIITFYLFSIVVNQVVAQYFAFSLFSASINVSYSVIILLLCATGFILGKSNTITVTQPEADKYPKIFSGWILAFVIIIINMLFLSLMLKKIYGYGYEHNLNVIGNLCLYFLLFLTLWTKLKKLRFRQSFGIILTIFFIILSIKNF